MITQAQQALYLKKINQYIERIRTHILPQSVPLTATFAHSREPVPFANRLDMDYQPIEVGARWGGAWDCAWFHLTGRVPAEWKGLHVCAHLNFNGEALAFAPDGTVLAGLTNGSIFSGKDEDARPLLHLFPKAAGGEDVELWLDAGANGLFGLSRPQDPARGDLNRHGSYEGKLVECSLAVFDETVWQLVLDLEVLLGVLNTQPETSTRRIRLLQALSDALDIYAETPANAAAARQRLAPQLACGAHASAVTACAVGHAHIDTAWLWPIRETVRKAARTFASQLDLMQRYPTFVFGASQPQLYAFIRDHYPSLYARVKQAVAEGRWEPQGAMWVEADCNLISGESMVRQVLHGKNFYRDELGFDVRNLWIPDVFGYSASMPQIMKRAGVDYFLTQKISWSQFNKFPHTTFRWRGIDGTEMLTHFPPENNYNSRLKPEQMARAEGNFKERAVLDEMMVLYGIGDGGGGPQAEHIEWGLRQHNLEGMPRLTFERVDRFFERLAPKADQLQSWSGELYLELHRGTLTTQGRTKRGNRKGELALREAEYLCSLAGLEAYPQDQLDRLWKMLLTNQFHDIIPGSSIRRVYEETEAEYAETLEACERMVAEAADRLFAVDDGAAVVINTHNAVRTEVIALPAGWSGAAGPDGAPLPAQAEPDGTVVAAVTLAPQAIVTLTRGGQGAPAAQPDTLVLENELVRYAFDRDARLVEAFDKQAGRSILAEGAVGNELTLYLDRPSAWDAWDIDIYYENQALETAKGAGVVSAGAGPVRQSLRFELTVGQSRLTQRVQLASHSKRLDFVTDVDWQERHRMLRVAFGVNVRADEASFEIQYGHVRRPTHRNTSWDMARFEVAAHRWADLSDNQYGAALLNDCKYGHKILDNVIDLNLLRAPTAPDPDADLGSHTFTYSLLPHTGTLITSDVMAEAAQLNQPARVIPGRRADGVAAPVTVAGEGVSLEVLKKAEKQDCLVIRLVETRGCRTTATVGLTEAGARLLETDLMEWSDLADLGGPDVEVPMQPFEIRTFRIAGAGA